VRSDIPISFFGEFLDAQTEVDVNEQEGAALLAALMYTRPELEGVLVDKGAHLSGNLWQRFAHEPAVVRHIIQRQPELVASLDARRSVLKAAVKGNLEFLSFAMSNRSLRRYLKHLAGCVFDEPTVQLLRSTGVEAMTVGTAISRLSLMFNPSDYLVFGRTPLSRLVVLRIEYPSYVTVNYVRNQLVGDSRFGGPVYLSYRGRRLYNLRLWADYDLPRSSVVDIMLR
jgi:hypothetical protein